MVSTLFRYYPKVDIISERNNNLCDKNSSCCDNIDGNSITELAQNQTIAVSDSVLSVRPVSTTHTQAIRENKNSTRRYLVLPASALKDK